jgi:hypothetical protein
VARDKNIPEQHDPNLGPVVTAVHIGGDSIVDRLLPHVKKIAAPPARWWWSSPRSSRGAGTSAARPRRPPSRWSRALELGDRAVVAEPIPRTPSRRTRPTRARPSADASRRDGQGRARRAAPRRCTRPTSSWCAGKLDAGAGAFRKLGAGDGDDAVLAREGVGVALETQAAAATDPAAKQALLEQALVAFRAVQPDDKGLRRDYALFHEARVLEAMGKPAEAVAPLTRRSSVGARHRAQAGHREPAAMLGAPIP